MKIIYSLLVYFIMLSNVFAQQRTLGTWKMFMPYGNGVAMVNTGDKVYHACIKSIFSYNKNTGEIRTYDKASGLNDLEIRTIAYDAASNTLAVAYFNGNIDFIVNETEVYNISDIKFENTTTSIGINAISFAQGKCYIAHDQGISVLDLSKKEIINTYIIGANGAPVRVYDVALDNTTIYAATQEGVKSAPLSSPNLQNYNNWSLIQGNGLPSLKAKFVDVFAGKIYAVLQSTATDTLFRYDGTSWTPFYFDTAHTITAAGIDNGTYYFSLISKLITQGKNGKINSNGSLTVNLTQGHVRPIGWFEENGTAYDADEWNGLFKIQSGNVENIKPNGPASANIHQLEFSDGALFVSPGSVNDSWVGLYNRDGFFVYENFEWKSRNQYTDNVLTNYPDVVSIAPNSFTGKTYFGSFLGGVIEYNNNSKNITTYDTSNSILEYDLGAPGAIKVSCMATDQKANVWMCNSGAQYGIKMIRPNGDWYQFIVPITYETMKQMIVDKNDQVWTALRGAAGGVMVWSYNGTLSNTSDDKVKLLSTGEGSGNLPDNLTYCITEDLDGQIWVGTNKGIATFYCPGSVLGNNGCDADRIKVERDGYIGYLFGNESVRAIAVDAANRKWVGTTNGVWLISSDGKKELLKFTTENSPLPSNQIADIAIDNATGEVFIGTVAGLISYQGDAQGECEDCKEALVYPNPVKPDYTGPIAIKGLADQAYVKITDASGNLMHQGKANGSQMIWDGKNYKGEKAASGIYLVFSSTDLGKERRVAKILLMN